MPEGFRIAAAWVSVSPDTSGFKEKLKEQLDQATAGVEGKARVTLDTSELDAKADAARAKVDELDGTLAEPSVRLDSAALDAQAEEARAKLDELDAKTARPDLGLEAGDLDTRVDEARAKLDELNARRADPRADLNTADFDAKYDEVQAKLAALREESASPRIGGSGGESGGGGGGREGGGLVGGIIGGIGALMPGIGGATTGLGLLAGTGALAFGGITKALSAAHQASQNVGMTGQQLAATQFSNAVAVQNAQRAIGQAHEQAAQDAVTSAQSIESAQMNLASTERNAAASQVQAIEGVQHAQQGLEEASYGLSEAQYNLNQAWVTAREDIAQLNDQLADSKLQVQQAQEAIQQALYNQRLVDQNAYSTALDRQQAALQVAQAQQQLKDAQDAETVAQTKANQANREGVAGSQTVIQAKQALTQAQYAQTNAQQSYADAQRNLTLTELNNAQQIKQAQMQVAQAQEQAAYTQMRDAQAVANAQQNLTNTIREQQLQMAATASTENQAANQFAKDMARLTPAGRAFVEQILGMRGAVRELEDPAQNAVLPGVTEFLRGAQILLPEIDSGVTAMGDAISQAFADFGQLMATPEFATALQGLISNGVEFADIVLPAFAQFVQELGWIGGQRGAVDGLANLLAGIAHGLTGMAEMLGQYMPQINDFLTAAGVIFAQIGPELGQIIGLVAQALEPLTSYLNAHPNGTIAVMLGDIVAGMLLFKPLVGVVTAPFNALTSAVESITGLPDKLKGIVDQIVAAWGKLTGLEVTAAEASQALSTGATALTADAKATSVVMPEILAGDAALVADRGILGRFSTVGASAAADSAIAGESGQWMAALGKGGGIFGGSGSGVLAGLGSLGAPELAALLGVPALVMGIGYYVDQVQAASDRAKGVIETSSGKLAAAQSASGTHVSAGFQQLADSIANNSQSTATVVGESDTAVSSRFGLYKDDWSKHNDALVNVMQLGKTQLGQAVAQFVNDTGGNVEKMGQSLREQGKTINQAYTDAMNQAFYDLGGKTRQSWAQAEQVMTQGLDKYYADMRQTTTKDYGSIQQVTNQLMTDYYNHRGDLEKQDWQRLMQVTQQYMTDANNGLIDTSKSNVKALSTDLAKFMSDLANGNSSSWAGDIKQLGSDTKQNFSDMTDSVDKAESHRFDQEIASAQVDFTQALTAANQQTVNLFAGHHAEGGYISGPGTGTSDSIPAMLSNGEFVINAESTAAFRPALEAINSNRFADGGFVDPALPRFFDSTKLLLDSTILQAMLSHANGAGSAGGTNNAGGFGGTPAGPIQQYAESQLAKYGWGANQMGPLIKLWNQESGWNPYAVNPSSGAYGIPQALPSAQGHPYALGDYMAQVNWGLNYIAGRYGSPAGAWSHETAYNWYDQGGWMLPSDMPGAGVPVNGLRKPEAVLTPNQWDDIRALAEHVRAQHAGAASASKQVAINFYGTQYPNAEQMAAIERRMGLALSGA